VILTFLIFMAVVTVALYGLRHEYRSQRCIDHFAEWEREQAEWRREMAGLARERVLRDRDEVA
jgi:hypothetical protein